MPTYVSDVLEATRQYVLSGQREERNKLSAAIVGRSTVVATMQYDMGSIDRGARISIDLEDMYVWSKSSQVATVDRAQFGSEAVDHDNGTRVYVNPKYSNFDIFKSINQELHALSSPTNGLFQVLTYELTYNQNILGYNFPYDVLDVYQVRYTTPGTYQDWHISQDWEFTQDSGSDFASGKALFVRDAYSGQKVLAKVKAPFTQLAANINTDIASSGLPESCYDILSLSAAWRLTSPREVARNFHEVQGDTRRAQEVPPGANLGGARELGRLRMERIREEASRLSIQYPPIARRYPYRVG